MSNIIAKAASYACNAHEGQFRKYFKERPYFTHVLTVASKVSKWAFEYPNGKSLVAVAFLHDVVEDCGVTFDDLTKEFGQEVADGVSWLTSYSKTINSKEKRAIRKQQDRDHLAKAPLVYKRIKANDRISNLEDVLEKCEPYFALLYADESEQLLEVIKSNEQESQYLANLIQKIRAQYAS